ncbi:carbohydrate ABC transporter permease [Lactococcus fujiensis]|uniref:ABC-type sugar transport system, permease component n=1 Tax=Lactococcus fujiensis JCM 16395 TaxID=1291764 RepID=A0A2A5RPM2_9LACT|nr:carbohydrate ABC transporter permease [Lactococcus fujiensis]PCS01387.1 ABC-type sugar transport system, permease component [Lactococcus fujiensis JCM 16395]
MLKKNKKSKKPTTLNEKIFNFVVYGVSTILILLIIYPLWFVIIASFSNPQDVASGAVWLWPKAWSLKGYEVLFQQPLLWRSYFNTIFYTVAGTLFGLLVNIPVAYALTRRDLVGRKWISLMYVIPMFVTGGLIPIYLVTKNFGLLNTIWVMIIPFAVSPYNIIVARTYFQESIPDGLWEAAQVDGSSTLRYFFTIVLPLSKAILAVIGLWTAVGIWNSWFNALIYLSDPNLQPLQLLLRQLLIMNQTLQTQTTGAMATELAQTSQMMQYASIVVSTLPIMLIYPFLQKYFNQGVMVGAIKE